MKTLIRSMVMTFSISAFAAWSAWAGELTIPFPNFEAGTTAVADQVDDNFAAVKAEVDDNDSRITDLEANGGGVVGSGTAGYIPIWTDSDSIGDSVIYEDSVSGNLAIGVIPEWFATNLTINEELGFSGTPPGIIVGNPSGYSVLYLGKDTNNYVSLIYRGTDANLYVEGGEPLALQGFTGDGKVGVGTLTPSLKFEVDGTAGGTSAWQTLSDIRYKENIEVIHDALSKLKQLRGVNFNWKEKSRQEKTLPKGNQIGLIAQEVKKVMPEVVHKSDNGDYSIEYSSIVPLLVEAIKQQQSIIDNLKKEVAELQQIRKQILKVNNLKAEIEDLRMQVTLIKSLINVPDNSTNVSLLQR